MSDQRPTPPYGLGAAGVDGQFGDDTLSAVKQFQGAKGLDVDGEVGPNTWATLRSSTEDVKT